MAARIVEDPVSISARLGAIVRVVDAGTGEGATERFLHSVVDETCGQPRGLASKFRLEGDGADGLDVPGVASACSTHFLAIASEETPQLEVLQDMGIAQEAIESLAAVYDARKRDLMAIASSRVSLLSSNRLTDFDWSLRLVIASDKRATGPPQPVLLLTLHTAAAGGKRRTQLIELSQHQLRSVLADLDRAQEIVSQFVSVDEEAVVGSP